MKAGMYKQKLFMIADRRRCTTSTTLLSMDIRAYRYPCTVLYWEAQDC